MRGLVFALLGQAALSACGIDASANPGARCDQVTSCPLPQTCYRGFCVHGDEPAIELDAALTPVSMGGPGLPSTNTTGLEAGAPASPPNTTATSGEAGVPVVPATGAPIVPGVPGAASASDAGSASTVAPTLADAAAPPAQVSTPPAEVATPPAQTSPPPASTDPAPQPAVPPVQTPAAPSMPVEAPVQTPPVMPPETDRPNNPPAGEQPASPLLVCLPLCTSRSVLCLVCLSGGLGNDADSCTERERRANRNVREMCDFLCSTLGCQR